MKQTLLAAALAVVSIFTATQSSHAQAAEEPHTADAVIAADKAWTVAEEMGDVAFVEALLLPEYRSISPDGSVHDRAAIVASTKKATPERAAMIEKYMAEHPIDMAVVINGNTAVLTFTAKGDDKKRVRSCDIFVYRENHWHALYSQHTNAEIA
jgi:hypothetical protein